MLKLKLPEIRDEIIELAPQSKIIESIRFVDQNRVALDVVSKLRSERAQIYFRKRLIDVALPLTFFGAALIFTISKTNKFENALCILPVNGILQTLVIKKTLEDHLKSSAKDIAHEFLATIKDDNQKISSICSKCIFYSEENSNHGVKYMQCAVQPYLVNTPEAIDCIDRE